MAALTDLCQSASTMSYIASEHLTRLADPVTKRDHVRGSADAPVVMVEYGDFECPFCGEAYRALKEVQKKFGADVSLVFRANPMAHKFPHSQQAAEAAEAAGAQGKFWEMHDLLFENQAALAEADLLLYAQRLGLDLERFTRELREHRYHAVVREQEVSGWHSHVISTPTLFINGVRFEDKADVEDLSRVIAGALRKERRARATSVFPDATALIVGDTFRTVIRVGGHELVADLTAAEGGTDRGPEPHDILLASLGACTAMTIQYSARKHGWPLRKIEIGLSQTRVGGRHRFRRSLRIDGDLTDEQRQSLLRAANQCPVSQTLLGEIDIETRLE